MDSQKMISTLVDGLESGKLLPPGVRAKILNSDYRLPLTASDLGVDLMAEFTIEAIEQKVLAAIECKSRLTPMTFDASLFRLRDARERLRASSNLRTRDVRLMVAAPILSEAVQRRCKEAGIGYIDLNGTLSLVHGGIYLDIAKSSKEFRSPQGIKNVFSGKSRRVLRVLLNRPFTPFRLDELAKEAELSIPQVFQVSNRLQDLDVIERTSAGRSLCQPGKLIRLFAAELKTDYQKSRTTYFGFSENKSDEVAREISKYCKSRDISYAFTLFSGLEPQEKNVIEELTAAYVSCDPAILAEDLGIPFTNRGSNVHLMQAPDVDNTAAGGVFYAPRILSSGRKAVNLVQEYLDFSMYPSRGEEQAQFLLNNVLEYRA